MPKLSIFLCMILVLCLWPVEARTYIVGNDGLATHKSIGDAISAASAGDTIYMKSGVYKEEVTIDKKIAIKPLTGERGTILMDGSDKGTGITLGASGCSIEGLTFKNFTKAGIFIQSNNNIIKNNQFVNDTPCILIKGAAGNKLDGNSMRDSYVGVVLWSGAMQNKITNNNIEGGQLSIFLNNVSDNYVADNTLSYARGYAELLKRYKFSNTAIQLSNSTNNTISRNNIKEGQVGLFIDNCTNCNLTDNIVSVSNRSVYIKNTARTELYNNSIREGIFGIIMDKSRNVVIKNCNIYNTNYAIGIGNSFGNSITENSILNTKDVAITLEYSNGTNIIDNQISKADQGLLIGDSTANRLAENKLNEIISLALYVDGSISQNYDNAIDESNTVDGKPIAYFYGQSNKKIEGRDLAQLTLAYCNNFTLEKNTISHDALLLLDSKLNMITENNVSRCYGIHLLRSSSNEISRNLLNGNKYSGLYLDASNSNNLNENTASENHQNGISLRNSSANTIQGNTVDRNLQTGIWLNYSNGNKIFENTASNNPTGILIIDASYNQVYHNNFLNNIVQAEDRNGMNRWDGGNGTGGNYWSDHKVVGNPSKGSPKVIEGSKMDNNPYQNENGWTLQGSAIKAASVTANQLRPASQEKALLSTNQSTIGKNNR